MFMETAKLLLEYIKALIWPLTVLLVALMFRREIRAILRRVKRAALPGGVSLDLEDEIRETTELATRIEANPAPKRKDEPAVLPLTEANSRMIELGLKPVPSGLDLNYYKTIAETDPTLALAGLRIELEILLRNLAKGFKVERLGHESPLRILRRLRDASKITSDQYELGQRILSLANGAVHGRSVSRNEANQIIEASKALIDDYLAWLSWGFSDGWSPPRKEDNR
jgi:hypothetical protein